MSIVKSLFGFTPEGKEVFCYTLSNKNGVLLDVINYGGIVVRLMVPDRNGELADIALGFDSLEPYFTNNPYFGAIIGRVGNRIAKGKFYIDGNIYPLKVNNGSNHLHGGAKGFNKVWWNVEPMESTNALKLTYVSADGEEGYPGKLNVEVVYTLTDTNEWKIEYRAVTDKKTVVNLTQHTYFNLTGDARNSILNHVLSVNASRFVPIDGEQIPTGKLASVQHTPFDFRKPTRVGERINQSDTQLTNGVGYDHCWVLDQPATEIPNAAVYDPASGRLLEVFTTEPGIQVYTGNFLDSSIIGKGNIAYQQRHGICLETEHFPDAPNQPTFPTVLLEPGKTYSTTTVYKFSIR